MTTSTPLGERRRQGDDVILCKVKTVSAWAQVPKLAGPLLSTALLLVGVPIVGCGAQIDRHGHVFIDVDLDQVQPGMTKQEVQTFLGSPDTMGTIGGDSYYYISTTTKTIAFLKPKEIDRQVVAVYFDGSERVRDVAHYGMKDGIVVDYNDDETPARGKDLGLIEQVFGNIANRGKLKSDTGAGGTAGIPGL